MAHSISYHFCRLHNYPDYSLSREPQLTVEAKTVGFKKLGAFDSWTVSANSHEFIDIEQKFILRKRKRKPILKWIDGQRDLSGEPRRITGSVYYRVKLGRPFSIEKTSP